MLINSINDYFFIPKQKAPELIQGFLFYNADLS